MVVVVNELGDQTTGNVGQEQFFASVPKDLIYHSGLTAYDLRVYATLAERAVSKGHAWPGIRRIASDLNMSKSTVQQAIERLESIGAVVVERRDGKSNDYWLPFWTVPGDGTRTRRRYTTVPGDGTDRVPGDGTELDKDRTRPTELPAQRWARRWCELTGQQPTRAVLKRFIPQIQDWMKTTGSQPTEEFLGLCVEAGIETPGGWGFISESPKPTKTNGGTVNPSPKRNNPDECTHKARTNDGWCAGCGKELGV